MKFVVVLVEQSIYSAKTTTYQDPLSAENTRHDLTYFVFRCIVVFSTKSDEKNYDVTISRRVQTSIFVRDKP